MITRILKLRQGILKVKVSLYHWPPVWLVWNQLYDNWQFMFYLQNRLIQTSQTGGQQYSDTSPFSIPWLRKVSSLILSCISSALIARSWHYKLMLPGTWSVSPLTKPQHSSRRQDGSFKFLNCVFLWKECPNFYPKLLPLCILFLVGEFKRCLDF